MLKPADPGPPPPERPVGELVHELIEEGKAYARAEIGLAKAIATAKGKALAWPAGLFLMALIVVQSAVTILAVGIFMALLPPLGPMLAAIIACLVFLGIAGALAWYGYQRLRRDF
jgi:TRAP-type C4-dicarboxylate transport system permease small subunit